MHLGDARLHLGRRFNKEVDEINRDIEDRREVLALCEETTAADLQRNAGQKYPWTKRHIFATIKIK